MLKYSLLIKDQLALLLILINENTFNTQSLNHCFSRSVFCFFCENATIKFAKLLDMLYVLV